LSQLSLQDKEVVESFWNAPIDFDDPRIFKDNSPFLVMAETPMSKIHFLFTMLNITLLYVV
jgi:uncharacterized protein with WD repeat